MLATYTWALELTSATTMANIPLERPSIGSTGSGPAVTIGRGEDLPISQRINHKYFSRKHLSFALITTAASDVPRLSIEQIGKNPTFYEKLPVAAGKKLVFSHEDLLKSSAATQGAITLTFPEQLNLPTIRVLCIKKDHSNTNNNVAGGGASTAHHGGTGLAPTQLAETQILVPKVGGFSDDEDEDEVPPPAVPVNLRQLKLENSMREQKHREEEEKREKERDQERARQEAEMKALEAGAGRNSRKPVTVVSDDDDGDIVPPPAVAIAQNPLASGGFHKADEEQPPAQRKPSVFDPIKAPAPVEMSVERKGTAAPPAAAPKNPKIMAAAATASAPAKKPVDPPAAKAAPTLQRQGTGKTAWWEWKSNVNGDDDNPKCWKKYMRVQAEKLEAAYRKDGGKEPICKLDASYSVCFDDRDFGMVQYRNDDKTRWRAVRRRGGEAVSRPKRKKNFRCCATEDDDDDAASIASSEGDNIYKKDSFLVSDDDDDSDDESWDSDEESEEELLDSSSDESWSDDIPKKRKKK